MMNLPPEILQFLGSLVAILALAWIAYALGLGGMPKLTDADAAHKAAGEAADGFQPRETCVDRNGKAAILRDTAGRILLLKPHGNKFAGRILGPTARAWQTDGMLVVDSGERRYGTVSLDIADPDAWADAVNALGSQSHA